MIRRIGYQRNGPVNESYRYRERLPCRNYFIINSAICSGSGHFRQTSNRDPEFYGRRMSYGASELTPDNFIRFDTGVLIKSVNNQLFLSTGITCNSVQYIHSGIRVTLDNHRRCTQQNVSKLTKGVIKRKRDMHFFKKKFTRCEYKEKIQKSLISLTVYEINDTFNFLRELTDI